VHQQGKSIRFELRLTQTHLADATGLTPVHVNRTLRALRDAQIVTITGRVVHIIDWDALALLGDFNATYLQADIKPEERLRIVAAA
jgi:DNA-binding transcriptional regulator LsrR (DeoR family)